MAFYSWLISGGVMSKIWRWSVLIGVCLLWLVGIHAQATDLQALVDGWTDGFAVSVRVTTPDDSFAAASGLVDVAGDEAAQPDSRFRIASMSKTFLAVVLLQLADEGVLALDDTAAKWLDAELIAQIENTDSATLYQMVTMTSGIAEYLNDDFYDTVLTDPTRAWTAPTALEYAYGLPASFAPGEGFEYVNTNYLLLQLVIEAATGSPFHEVVRERILDPLGMNDTYTQGQEDLAGGFVHGYEDVDGDGNVEDVTAINDGWGLADGGLISTTGDLTRFYTALFVDQTLLSDEMFALLTDGGDNEYGTGLEVVESDYGLLYGHTGSVLGFSGMVFYAEDLEAIAVILYAAQAGAEGDLDAVFELVAGE
jgi:CubicO group peptidase (beta-lactamase class C family)